MSGDDLGEPDMIEPPIFLTCSIVSSGNFPLTNAAAAVRDLFTRFVENTLHQTQAPGVEWIGAAQATTRTSR